MQESGEGHVEWNRLINHVQWKLNIDTLIVLDLFSFRYNFVLVSQKDVVEFMLGQEGGCQRGFWYFFWRIQLALKEGETMKRVVTSGQAERNFRL